MRGCCSTALGIEGGCSLGSCTGGGCSLGSCTGGGCSLESCAGGVCSPTLGIEDWFGLGAGDGRFRALAAGGFGRWGQGGGGCLATNGCGDRVGVVDLLLCRCMRS